MPEIAVLNPWELQRQQFGIRFGQVDLVFLICVNNVREWEEVPTSPMPTTRNKRCMFPPQKNQEKTPGNRARKRTFLVGSFFLLLIAPLILSACEGDSGGGSSSPSGVPNGPAIAERAAEANLSGSLPGGPDAIGGTGSLIAGDIGDFVLANDYLRAVIDQPGLDPTTPGGSFPLANLFAPTGGTLIDLASAASDNDQWLQMHQGVIGRISRFAGVTGATISAAGGGPALVDPNANFTNGVAAGDTLTILSGLNAGNSYRIGLVVNATTLALFVPPGHPFETDSYPPPGSLTYAITHTTSPGDNVLVYDSAEFLDGSGSPVASYSGAEARLRLTGGIVNLNLGESPDGVTVNPSTGRLLSAGLPIVVETDYILGSTTPYLTVETRISNPTAGGTVSLAAIGDLVALGGISQANLSPWTPLVGFAAQGLSSPVTVPFVGFQGRDLPPVSYTVTDVESGQIGHASDGQFTAFNTQLEKTGSLAPNESLTWRRHISVGKKNDIASAADQAVSLLAASPFRVNPTTNETIPNGISATSTIRGIVLGAPSGTTITAFQTSPALIFDPGPPYGVSAADGFYPSPLAGVTGVPVSQTVPAELDGRFQLLLPMGFAGLSGTAIPDLAVPVGFENGSTSSTYQLLLEAPGHESQEITVRLPEDTARDFLFYIGAETGTIEVTVLDGGGAAVPAKILIVGMDPDGPGPAPATPNPDFGDTPRASGQGHVAYLLDGTGNFAVPPGQYQVIASRGLEYSIGRFPAVGAVVDSFLIGAGERVQASIQIARVLDQDPLPDPGGGTFANPMRRYVSVGLNAGTGRSFNASIPPRDLALAYLASGVEVLVSGESDNLADLATAIAGLEVETTQSLSTMIASQVGVKSEGGVPVNSPGVLEFPNTIGSFSAWPLPVDPVARRNGAPADEYRSPAILFEQYRALGATVVQLNHPRSPIAVPPLQPVGAGFFTNGKAGYPQTNTGSSALAAGGYGTPLQSTSLDGSLDDLNTIQPGGSTRYNDFDTLGIDPGALTLYDINRLDWYALLSAGYVRTATASPQTTTLTGGVGYPRTYVFAPGDGSADIGAVSLSGLNNALLPSLVQASSGTTVPPTSFPAMPRVGAAPDDMEVLGSSGPVVIVEVDANEDGIFESMPGDLTPDGPGGNANLVDVRITILAAPWVPVNSATLILNGGSAATPLTGLASLTLDLSPDLVPVLAYQPFSTDLADVVRLRNTYTVPLPGGGGGDHWLAVEARGFSTSGDLYDLLVPDSSGGTANALGWTNPVFIDTNQNGLFDPPGVP